MVLPLKSNKHVRIQVYEEPNSITISWKYKYPIKEKRRAETGSLLTQLRIYYEGRIIFSYSERPTLAAASPQLEAVKVGLSNTNREQRLELSDSLEQLGREAGLMMIPGTELYQVRLEEVRLPRPAGQQNVTNIKETNITVELPFVMTLFEEPFSLVTIKRDGILFGGNGNHLSVVDINPRHISYGTERINGTPCFSVSWWAGYHQSRVDCLLCHQGRLIFRFLNLTADHLENLRLVWNNMAVSLLPSGLERNIKTNVYQIIFSPRSSCSLPDSCLSSPDCPLFSKLQNCRRFRCLTPSSPSSPSSSCSPPLSGTAGVLTGLLVLAVMLAVITYILRRLNIHLAFLSFQQQGSLQELRTCQDTEDTAL